MSTPLEIETIVSQPFMENTYVLWRPGRTDAVVFDPGLQPDLILDLLRRRGLGVVAILNTHGHADHIGGNAALKRAFPEAPLIIGVDDEVMLTDAQANLSAPFGIPVTSPRADRTVQEGDVVEVGGFSLEVQAIPGHSPGHVVYILREEPIHVFGGDVLFSGSIGRSDFPGGSERLLLQGIREKLLTLPDDTLILSGHGPVTTVGEERRSNPFL